MPHRARRLASSLPSARRRVVVVTNLPGPSSAAVYDAIAAPSAAAAATAAHNALHHASVQYATRSRKLQRRDAAVCAIACDSNVATKNGGLQLAAAL